MIASGNAAPAGAAGEGMLAELTRTRWQTVRARAGAALASPLAVTLSRWLSPVVGAAMIGALIYQASDIGWSTIARVFPRSPWFYLIFAAAYIGPIFTEMSIYRKLWHLNWTAAPMFFRKRVMNEALFGYSGEAYAVFWARARGVPGAAALAAVRDINILSAAIGILSTVMLLALTLFLAEGARLANAAVASSGPAVAVALIVMLAALLVIALKPRLFSLPRSALLYASAVHAGRVVFSIATTVGMWAIALPGYSWALWLTLAAWRAFFQRLPLVPNKDLLFVNLAILALTERGGKDVAALLASTAALTLAAHVVSMVATSLVRSPTRAVELR